MTENQGLENITGQNSPTGLEATIQTTQSNQNPASAFKKYIVDVSAAWMFYMPTSAVLEFASGMSMGKVAKARASAALVHAAMMRPYGKFRGYWAEKVWKAGPNSSFLKKFLSDTTATLLVQLPVYTGILFASGASLEEIYSAVPKVVGFGIATGRIFGKIQDKWRVYCGTKNPVFEK